MFWQENHESMEYDSTVANTKLKKPYVENEFTMDDTLHYTKQYK